MQLKQDVDIFDFHCLVYNLMVTKYTLDSEKNTSNSFAFYLVAIKYKKLIQCMGNYVQRTCEISSEIYLG